MRDVSPSVGRPAPEVLLLADVHERGILTHEAHLDVTFGQLPADLHRGLAEGVEKPQPCGAANRLQHSLGRGAGLLVADRGHCGHVCSSDSMNRAISMASL